MIEKPDYYNQHPSDIEVWEIVKFLPFPYGNVFKYLARHEGKNGAEDLAKAIVYLRKIKADNIDYPEFSSEMYGFLDKWIAAEESLQMTGVYYLFKLFTLQRDTSIASYLIDAIERMQYETI